MSISIIVPTLSGKHGRMPDGDYEIILSDTYCRVDARNIGAMNSSGDILVFVDDDMDLYGNINRIERDTEHNWWKPTYMNVGLDGHTALSALVMNSFRNSGGPCIAIRKDLFYEIGMYNNVWMEDTDLRNRLLEDGNEPGNMHMTVLIRKPFTRFPILKRSLAR